MRDKSWEFSGKSVEEAIETALEELGLERDDIHVEVIEEPQKGFLGLGEREARIRVDLIGEWEVVRKNGEGKGQESENTAQGSGSTEEECATGDSARAENMVRNILKMIGVDAMVEAKESKESVDIDVWGEDVAVLIGKGGNTLEAMQYIVNVACRRRKEFSKRIVIDIEGYRRRRKSKIEKLVEESARRSVSEGKAIELPPMNPSERRLAHLVLRSIKGVTSESVGEDPARRVVIRPIGNVSRET